MASVLDRYGIKEVADVTFYEINADGTPGAPKLYLDTLKVSTIEQTAEMVDAQGGKGNPKLISWDYGKDITVTLEDALFSAKSMAIMLGNGTVSTEAQEILKTMQFVATADGVDGIPTTWEDVTGKVHNITNPKIYSEDSASVETTAVVAGKTYFVTFSFTASNPGTIEVGSSTFPGTYYVTGDTFARSETTGKDEYFQFIIPKAKMTAENTITLEAEGDPTVFSMNLTVLRSGTNTMMRLVKYDTPM